MPGKSCSMVEVDGDGGWMYIRGDASHEGEREAETEEEKGRRKNPVVTLGETDSSNKEERESDGGQGKETENLELEHFVEGDKESGWKKDSGEKRFEKIDMRQLKENMGDCMNILVENLVPLPKEDREKILSQYMSIVDEKDKKMTEITVRWAVNKLAEEKAAERERSVMEAQRGTRGEEECDMGGHVGRRGRGGGRRNG